MDMPSVDIEAEYYRMRCAALLRNYGLQKAKKALQSFNLGTIVEWEHDSTTMQEDKIQEYWKRAQSHTDMMTYQIGDGVFEFLTFAKNGKGENVHKVSAKGKKCSCGKWRNLHMPRSHAIKFCEIRGIEPKDYVSKYYGTKYYKRTYNETFTPVGQQAYWPPAPFCLIANIESLRISSVDSRTRLKNDMDIASARMARKCSIFKQTGHTKARCPRRN
ncbi:hypothetical protein T459_05679 [Capsicum annuum]|uniref:Uncharacterized protein n=1 Tax=Capsicum annuum TaxID=4072 RepID=A0A2G3A8J8_CAPAN|nr:hypothetical protein T459_05679 [Capsicum annuum]